MKEIIEAYFNERSLVNHQIGSYDDCIPSTGEKGDGKNQRMNRMERIVRSIRVGTDEIIEDDEGGMIKLDVLDKEIIVRIKNVSLGKPVIREANGSIHESTPVQCRLRKLTYESPLFMDFKIYRDDKPVPDEETKVQIGSLPIMVRSQICNLHRTNIDKGGAGKLNIHSSVEDLNRYHRLLEKYGEDPLDPGGYFIINGTERVLISMEDLAPNRVTVELSLIHI